MFKLQSTGKSLRYFIYSIKSIFARLIVRDSESERSVLLTSELLLNLDAISPAELELRAHAMKEEGNLTTAVEMYRAALSRLPDSEEIRLHLAHCLKNKGDLDDAVAEFVRLAKSIRFALEAEEQLRSVLPALFVERANDLRSQKDWEGAAANYGRSLQLLPRQKEILVQLGHALKEALRPHEANEAYRRATRLSPNDPEPWLNIAHVLRVTGPREESVAAFARAWVLGDRRTNVSEALKNATGYCFDEVRRALETQAHQLCVPVSELQVQIEEIAPSISFSSSSGFLEDYGRAVVYLSGIDWGYRRQRPQSMAEALAQLGRKVFFVSTVFDQVKGKERFLITRRLAEKVAEVRLQIEPVGSGSLHFALTQESCASVARALDELCNVLGQEPIVIIDHPAWFRICEYMQDKPRIVYDCIDNIRAFSDVSADTVSAEDRLIEQADVVIAPAKTLVDSMARRRAAVLIPNGAQTKRFKHVASLAPSQNHVTVLYFGMIGEWFAWQWIEHAALARPDWKFNLIGEAVPDLAERLSHLCNVKMIGERHHEELPIFLAEASVCIIPFLMSELTHAVNPVKVYEYLSAGRPVVASAMQDLANIPWVYRAENQNDFTDAMAEAIFSDTPELRQERSKWAMEHDWACRARDLDKVLFH